MLIWCKDDYHNRPKGLRRNEMACSELQFHAVKLIVDDRYTNESITDSYLATKQISRFDKPVQA
jgi:hypothetical protein